jgi:hypothetical protein
MYNYKEAFDKEAQLAAEQEVAHKDELVRDTELRLINFIKKIQEKFSTEDPEVLLLVQLEIQRGYYTQKYKEIDKTLDFLYEKSETLIESHDSNTPEVLERRMHLKDNINLLLEQHELVRKGLEEVEKNSFASALIPKDKHIRAQKIITDLNKEMDELFTGLQIDLE